MRMLAAALVAALALTACSGTTETPEPQISASTVLQQDVNDFCDDVRDAITSKDATDAEDQTERLTELQEMAQDLGIGTRDDMYAAEALTACEKELQDAINAG
ncbi:MAG: hypothetical protein V9E82_08800 [Candidatus Nanopelagicales bacterium]